MDKLLVIQHIQSSLASELAELASSGDPTQGARVREIQSQLLMYQFLPKREYTDQDVVCPGALVGLEFNGQTAHYLIVPSGGGLVTRVEGYPVQVITPQSPIGGSVLGKKVGETAEVPMREGAPRRYRVVELR